MLLNSHSVKIEFCVNFCVKQNKGKFVGKLWKMENLYTER